MTVIGAGSYSIKSVSYNNDITVIKDNQNTDTNVSSSGINSKLENAEAASDKSVDDVYADDEQVKEADKTPRHSDPNHFLLHTIDISGKLYTLLTHNYRKSLFIFFNNKWIFLCIIIYNLT